MASDKIKIAIAWADAAGAHEHEAQVAVGTTLGDLFATDRDADIGLLSVPRDVLLGAAGIGVWGRARPKTYILRDGDRVELYAPLQADPKEQRRRRVR